MLPSSARELWPFCVLRDSCHAALPDQPGLPPIARDAGLAALAAVHTPSDLRMMDAAWIQWVLGHAAWVCLCQIASQWLKRAFPMPYPRWSRLELFVCSCVLVGDVLSARAGRGAATRYD